jgi:hypothetical protein
MSRRSLEEFIKFETSAASGIAICQMGGRAPDYDSARASTKPNNLRRAISIATPFKNIDHGESAKHLASQVFKIVRSPRIDNINHGSLFPFNRGFG